MREIDSELGRLLQDYSDYKALSNLAARMKRQIDHHYSFLLTSKRATFDKLSTDIECGVLSIEDGHTINRFAMS